MDATRLINELIKLTRQNKNDAQAFRSLSDEALNFKPNAERWSVLECLEHLNRYGDFYIPEIKDRMTQSKYPASGTFKPGWLGNYFSKSMWPKEKLNKMKTFTSMNPVGSALNRTTLDQFIHQQDAMLDLLKAAKQTNLTKVKTAITISKWIKLRLGDTFRVVIYHNHRHILQAQQVLKERSQQSAVHHEG